MKLIGKGLFSKVYLLNEKQVLIKSDDYAKECISYNHTTHFPKFERIDYQEYICEYYPKVTSLKNSLNPDHYRAYQELRAIPFNNGNKYDGLFYWESEFKKLKNNSFKKSLLEVLDALSNYGSDICFEISPRNVAVKNGKLILLDVFFFNSQLQQKRKY